MRRFLILKTLGNNKRGKQLTFRYIHFTGRGLGVAEGQGGF